MKMAVPVHGEKRHVMFNRRAASSFFAQSSVLSTQYLTIYPEH
jgi:hypothetical protein